MALSNQQIAERKLGIGGSDVHHLTSEPPYGCRRWLWYDKRDVVPDYPKFESNVMKRGSLMEDLVAKEYMEHHPEHKLVKVNLPEDPERPWLRGNPDRRILGDPRGVGIMEIKVPGREVFNKIKVAGILTGYIMQEQYYLGRDNRDWGIFTIFWADGWELMPVPVERDQEMIDLIFKAAEDFWRQVENGPAPDKLDPFDKRCQKCNYRAQCQGLSLLQSIDEEPVDEKDIVKLTEIDEYVPELLELEEIKNECELRIEQIKGKIKRLIGDTPVADSTGFRWYYRVNKSMRLNIAQLRKDKPRTADKYSYESISRPLRKYPK